MNIAFEEHGSGKPLVLLHAFPLSRKMWSPNVEAFARENFRVVLPDLRGFGENVNFADINTMEAMAQDVAELLDVLKIEKVIVGGLSMGGYVAFNLFRLYPEKFAALVLCDTNSAADTDEKRGKRLELIEKIEDEGAAALAENMLPALVSEHTKENNPQLMAKIEKMFADTSPQAAIAALRGMAEREDRGDVLSSIKIPTLLVFGEEDSVTNLDVARKMHEQIAGSNLATIKNAGHYANLEQPEQFNRLVVNFIKGVKY